MAKFKDKMKGGKADKKKPSDFDKKSLRQGIKVEREHTKDKSIAREIAMDHLTEDKQYYKKLKQIEKKDFIEITPDGKREIVQGEEPLKKDPKLNKSIIDKHIKDRWQSLKKGLKNLESIMDLASATAVPKSSEEQPEQEQPEQEQPEQEQPEQDSQVEQLEDQNQSSDDQNSQPQPEDQQMPQEADMGGEAEPQFNQEEAEQQIIDSLREEGYSDPEIAYIVHGHHSPIYDESNAAKAEATRAMSEVDTNHASKMSDLEHEMERKRMELEHAHTQRMKDLEYEHAKASAPDGSDKEMQKKMMELELQQKALELDKRKQEIAIELEFKRRELEMKLKHADDMAKKKMSQMRVSKDRSLNKSGEDYEQD